MEALLFQVVYMESFQDYEQFKTNFFKLSFIDLNLYKENQMKRRITAIAEKYGFSSYCSFLNEMKRNRELYNIFINYLTINVSEFYRNPNQWAVFENKILKEISKYKNLSDIRIWSAACSTGDEPYTVVMILNKYIPLSRINILATDIDTEAMQKAKTGIYSKRSLKEIPAEFLRKYFNKIDEEFYQISDRIKKCVCFRKHNLLRDPYPPNMDIIICRNVLIYFTEEAKKNIYKNFSKSLVKNGILFVGSTEQIMDCQKYGIKQIGTFFYQKKES
jgi:chemotaxis protein methyltransferase CheR